MRRQRILERVGWTFWRCFGSNYTLDRDGVLEDLFQTLDRMGIAPVGMASSSSEYTEHRIIRASREEDRPDQKGGEANVLEDPEAIADDGARSDPDAGLRVGDKIIIRYLDDPRSRQECYILTDKANDQLNGLLSLSSPLAKALCDALPGDEVSLSLGDRERTVLFMSLDREPRKVAA